MIRFNLLIYNTILYNVQTTPNNKGIVQFSSLWPDPNPYIQPLLLLHLHLYNTSPAFSKNQHMIPAATAITIKAAVLANSTSINHQGTFIWRVGTCGAPGPYFPWPCCSVVSDAVELRLEVGRSGMGPVEMFRIGS